MNEKLELAGCYFTEFGAALIIFLLQANWSVSILNYTLSKDGFPKGCQQIFFELLIITPSDYPDKNVLWTDLNIKGAQTEVTP